MRISSGDVEEVLAQLNCIDPRSRVAFRARIKHFQRLGFPSGVNTGKGRPADHTLATLFQLVFAFDLSQCGLPPVMVARIVKRYWWLTFCPAVIKALAPGAAIPDPAGGIWERRGDQFFVLSPSALQPLALDSPDEWDDLAELVPQHDLIDRLDDPLQSSADPFPSSAGVDGPWRAIVIHVNLLTEITARVIGTVLPELDWEDARSRLIRDYEGHELFDVAGRVRRSRDGDQEA